MNPQNREVVDHIDKNGLNNRKYNLRNVEVYINNRNMNVRKDNKTGMIGVYYSKANNQWRAKWYDENHKMCQKAFSCNKYGYDEAKQLAIDYRVAMMENNNYIYDEEMYRESSETIPMD